MNYTITDLSTSLLATIVFGLVLLPASYLFLVLTDLLSFRSRSLGDRCLWIVAFSIPLSLFITAVVGQFVPRGVLAAVFVASALSAAVLLVSHLWRRNVPLRALLRWSKPILLALLGFIGYVLFITTPVQIGSRLYESVNFTDWSVRLPLVSGAMRDGMPPGNPFFTVSGHPQPSHYYYYWYVLCAQVGRPLHLPTRACLTASAIWSGLALVAVLFLLLKHLLGFHAGRYGYVLALVLCCVMGVDILPTFAGYFLHPPLIYPEMEWWLNDRIPSFLGAVIFAPHHIGGVVSCVFAFLVLCLSRHPNRARLSGQRKALSLAVIVPGICFAACAGDSTYVACCFVIVGALYALDLLRQGEWIDLLVLCGSGLVAGLVSVPFLRQMTSVVPGLTSGHHRIFAFALRNTSEHDYFVGALVSVTKGHLQRFLRFSAAPVLIPLQFGFFLVPLFMRVRHDYVRLRSGGSLSDGERMLWAIFLGTFVPALFISSAPEGVNDFGRHAALVFRLVMIAWATPLLWPYLERLRRHEPMSAQHPWRVRSAMLLLVLGICSQLWQILSDRGLMPFLAYHPDLSPQAPVSQDADVGGRFFQIRRGLDIVEKRLPPNALVQSNMGGAFQNLVMLYSSHPFAAGDVSCESAFGGDPRLCLPVVLQLQRLFGSFSDVDTFAWPPYEDVPLPNPAQTTKISDFMQACHDLHLAAVLAQDTDFAWSVPGSWVWQLKPLYAAPMVRIIGCPGADSPSQHKDRPA